jgi:Ca-activated chloride channel family protein
MSLAELHFRNPWLFSLALLAIPVWLLARQAGGRVIYSSLGALPPAGHSLRARLSWLPDLGLALATVCLAIALAGPRTFDQQSTIRAEGIAIAMVVDVSGSMAALDLGGEKRQLDRLEVVKRVFRDFVKDRPDDAIGLVSFARYADTRAPLTLDHQMLLAVLAELHLVTERREDGTAVGDGLGMAVTRLKEAKAESRVAILLTDGVSNAGELTPVAAAELARANGIKVYTIGAGTNGMAPMPVDDPFSGQKVLRAVPVEIDEATLKQVADKTGGQYFRATDGEALRRIYAEIDRLERTQLDAAHYTEPDEHYGVSLAAGLVLACLAWLARATLFRRLP